MPSEENKSKEQKTAELKSTVFGKALARFSPLKRHAWQRCSRTRKNPNHPLIFANDSFLSLAGYDREEVLAQSFDFLMARPLDHEAWTQVEAAFADSSEGDLDICFRRTDDRGRPARLL
jgi:PAS domain-containing protein